MLTTHIPTIQSRKGAVRKVYRAMSKGRWMTLEDIREATGYTIPVQSISARLRDLRKAEFGGHDVPRRATQIPGLFQYKLIKNHA